MSTQGREVAVVATANVTWSPWWGLAAPAVSDAFGMTRLMLEPPLPAKAGSAATKTTAAASERAMIPLRIVVAQS